MLQTVACWRLLRAACCLLAPNEIGWPAIFYTMLPIV